MLMNKTVVLTETDVANYVLDLVSDPTTPSSDSYVTRRAEVQPGAEVHFQLRVLGRARGPVAVLSLSEHWQPEPPKRLEGKALRKYQRTRDRALRMARKVGARLGRIHPTYFHYVEPPVEWRPPDRPPRTRSRTRDAARGRTQPRT